MRHIVVILSLGISLISAAAIAETKPIALDLCTAARLAVQNNPQLQSVNASADMSKALVDKAKTGLLPTVTASSGYSFVSKDTTFFGTPVLERNTWINRVAAQQIIYSGGQVQAQVNQAKQGYMAAQQTTAAARADVITNVSDAYYQARQAKESIAVAESSVKSQEANLYTAKKLNESGVVTKADVLRAEVALTNAKEQLIDANNYYATSLANLKTAMGIPQDTPIELQDNASDLQAISTAEIKAATRAEVAAGEASLRAAQAGKKAAKAGRLPTVSATADFFNEPVGAQFPRRSNTVMAGLLVSLPVFDAGITRANVSEADAAIRKAQSDLESVKQNVALQQETAKLNLESANAKVETTTTQVQSAQESLRVLKAGYAEGINPMTDVLAAESALTAAQYTRLAALYDVRVAQVNYLRAYGRTDVLGI